jgi:disulfide bond formation protein DsbB
MLAYIPRVSRYPALLTACVATAGSLYFSLVLHWPPCDLCWYQRICMYPLTVIIAVNTLRQDGGLEHYVMPLSLTGAVIAMYHFLLQKTDWFTAPMCLSGVPCTGDYLNWFGVITIPLLALIAFVLIVVFTLATGLQADDNTDEYRPAPIKRPVVPVALIVGSVALAFGVAAWLHG